MVNEQGGREDLVWECAGYWCADDYYILLREKEAGRTATARLGQGAGWNVRAENVDTKLETEDKAEESIKY